MNILIIGQTTLHWGRMEFGNIGNYYIIEPFIRELHSVFKNASIKTTLQMSDRFCKDENIEILPMELYYDFKDKKNLINAKKEVELVEKFIEYGNFDEITPYIREVLDSDIIIDFSGDIWGDNANLLGIDRFEVGLYKDMVAQKLGKPTFMLAGSPGPFNDERIKELAKEVFENFTMVTNREPLSTVLLKKEGFNTSNTKDLACPAFLFEPAQGKAVDELLKFEGLLDKEKPIVGFVLCGWNFIEGPFDKWPREDDEYIVFAEAVEYISNNLGAIVCLMSHSNGFYVPPANFGLTHGRDYPVIKQLQRVIKNRGIAKEVVALDGIYDAWTTKAIIKKLDMLVSGRVHAAVAGFSQYIPTVVIDYGHEPKAHKLRGFAMVAGQEEYVSDPSQNIDLINNINKCWRLRNEIKSELQKKIPSVEQLARENFKLIEEYVHKM